MFHRPIEIADKVSTLYVVHLQPGASTQTKHCDETEFKSNWIFFYVEMLRNWRFVVGCSFLYVGLGNEILTDELFVLGDADTD